MHIPAFSRYIFSVMTFVVFILSALTVTGCSDNAGTHVPTVQVTDISSILQTETPVTSESEISLPATIKETTSGPSMIMTKAYNGADIDLTVLSANMVYAQVFSMVMEPDEYIGLTVRMEGQFVFFHDEGSDKNYYACLIKDAAQCCAQGMEFEPSEEYSYPGDFPEDGELIRVLGIFDMYEENGNKYLTLRDAVLEPVTHE